MWNEDSLLLHEERKKKPKIFMVQWGIHFNQYTEQKSYSTSILQHSVHQLIKFLILIKQ